LAEPLASSHVTVLNHARQAAEKLSGTSFPLNVDQSAADRQPGTLALAVVQVCVWSTRARNQRTPYTPRSAREFFGNY
jgi:hypothetical protein